MKFLIIILFAPFYFSCGQSTAKNNIPEETRKLVPDPEGNQKDPFSMGVLQPGSDIVNEENKHPTFNEAIDTLPGSLKIFVPEGYSAIHISSGDANLDRRTDKILVLRKSTEETTSNYAEDKPDRRPLLLFLGQVNNSYQLAIRNDNAAFCIDCGGAFGDPFTGTTIKHGFFSIEHGIAADNTGSMLPPLNLIKHKTNGFFIKIISSAIN